MTEQNADSQDEALDEAVEELLEHSFRGEEPDLDEFAKQYPGLESKIKQKFRACQRVGSLFDSLREADDNEFQQAVNKANLVGHKIGAFEITEIIGRGGMGVVYKGHDSRLDRMVAIKAMPAHLLKDKAAQARFRREARLLASLSHPNIGAIHDIIEQADRVDYLILEHVPGQTLAELIAAGPMKVREALSVALKIAEAVAAAHENGAIHRDLKPSNIKITPEGKVKVLDFGLAKAALLPGADPQSRVTEAGRIVGTPAYMSPEQTRGKPLDRRTDIWSFGCLLYEMLTGHLAFEGETTTDILARIIEREPDWDRLPVATPPNIRALLRRCLAKEPHRRLQHIGDAALEIDETLTLPVDESGIGGPVVGKTRRSLGWLAVVCSFAGLIVGFIAASLSSSSFTSPSPSKSTTASRMRTTINLPADHVLGFFRSSGLGIRQTAFALSPDGSRLVYVADLVEKATQLNIGTQLFVRLMHQYEVQPIPGTEGASSPFFSPDGQSVGFFVDEKLKTVTLRGEEPRIICEASFPRPTGSWGDDDMIYFIGRDGLSRVSADGGDVELLAAESDPVGGNHPQLLPGGKAVLMSSREGAVYVSLETMERKLLFEDAHYVRYVPTGHLVYERSGALEAVPFSLTTLKGTSPPAPVIPKILFDSVYGSVQFAFSDDGVLVYVPGDDTGKTIPTWVDRQGNEEPLDMPAKHYGTPKLSPDGEDLAIVVKELQSNVYIYDVATGRGSRLTLEGNNSAPVWTPYSERVTFSRRMEGEENCYLLWQPADGSGEAESLYSSRHNIRPYSWSSDGKLLTFSEWPPTSESDVWVLSLEGDREPELKLRTEFREHFSTFSPDGRWMAYMSNKEGKSQVYVQPYPAMDRLIPISYGLGEEPIWSPKGNELFYRSNDKWMVVSISTEPEFKAGTPEVLFEGPYINVDGMSYDVAPDGQRLLVLKPQYDDSQVRELHVVTNWFEELKELVPTESE